MSGKFKVLGVSNKLYFIAVFLSFFIVSENNASESFSEFLNQAPDNHSSISTPEIKYSIYGCTRTINSVDENKPKFKNIFSHCYVKFIKNDGYIVDSRGYFEDVGSTREPNQTEVTELCQLIQFNAQFEEWKKVTEIYDQKDKSNYRLTSHNCCTVADEAISTIKTTNFFRDVNSGIGTRFKIPSKYSNNDKK